MCTMSWFVKEDGYELFFNRDEHISRSRAQVPTVQVEEGVSYISPTDTDAGGTWISSNQYGVTVCLLNHYQFEQIATYKAWVSRGEMVRRFALTTDLAGAETQFSKIDLDDFRAFRMFIIEPNGSNRLFVWDGHQARVEKNVSSPKSSSSVDAQYVKSLRKQRFTELGLADRKDPKAYLAYHSSHHPSSSKESVCMHRTDANTVSLSHIEVGSGVVAFSYADGSPCSAKLGAPVNIDVVRELAPMRQFKALA